MSLKYEPGSEPARAQSGPKRVIGRSGGVAKTAEVFLNPNPYT